MSGAAFLIFEKAGPKSWVPKGKKSAPTRVPPFASSASLQLLGAAPRPDVVGAHDVDRLAESLRHPRHDRVDLLIGKLSGADQILVALVAFVVGRVDQELFGRTGDAQRGLALEAGDHPDDDVDLVLADELARLVDGALGGGLIVLHDEGELPAIGPARGIDVVDRELEAALLGFAEDGLQTRKRGQEADLDGVGRLQECRKAQRAGGQGGGPRHSLQYRSPGEQSLGHVSSSCG